jgi:hypothetical protein
VNDKGYLLELAKALRSNSDREIMLCGGDAELCSKALTMVTTAKSRRAALPFTVPAALLALLVGGVVGHMWT